MKGGRCFGCDSVIETDNEDCLCNNCLAEMEYTSTTPYLTYVIALVFVALIVVASL